MRIIRFDMDKGSSYENTYGKWMSQFEEMATSDEDFVAEGCPKEWLPLVWYFGGSETGITSLTRNAMEQACCAHPVLVDSFWRAHFVWSSKPFRQLEEREDLLITNHLSFYSPPLMEYRKRLQEWMSAHHGERRNKVLVVTNCSADKPYPAELHRAILKTAKEVGADVELLITTGACGAIPQELFGIAPLYDSGVPNKWNCQQTLEEVASAVWWESVVVFTEFLSESAVRAFTGKCGMLYVPLGSGKYHSYLPLAESELQGVLKNTLQMCKTNQKANHIPN